MLLIISPEMPAEGVLGGILRRQEKASWPEAAAMLFGSLRCIASPALPVRIKSFRFQKRAKQAVRKNLWMLENRRDRVAVSYRLWDRRHRRRDDQYFLSGLPLQGLFGLI